jgi:hypothetical protein
MLSQSVKATVSVEIFGFVIVLFLIVRFRWDKGLMSPLGYSKKTC